MKKTQKRSTGWMRHMSSAYSRVVRSLLNMPDPAVLMMLIFVHCARSTNVLSTLAWYTNTSNCKLLRKDSICIIDHDRIIVWYSNEISGMKWTKNTSLVGIDGAPELPSSLRNHYQRGKSHRRYQLYRTTLESNPCGQIHHYGSSYHSWTKCIR